MQAFLKNFGRHGGAARADHHAAYVYPVHQHAKKADQLLLGAYAHRGVHHDVVEVLAQGAGVVGEHDIPASQTVGAIDGQAIAHGRAQRVGHENRQAAAGL